MNKSRFVARYDGKAWGVWDRNKNRWESYPAASDQAREAARTLNAPCEEPRLIPISVKTEPTYTNIPARPDLGVMPPLEFKPDPPRPDFNLIMSNIGNPAPIIGPRVILGAMLAGMQEEMEEIREREMAKLPVQPLAIPMCPHCSEIELRKRSRN